MVDINDLLFRPANDNVKFEVSEIFLEPAISLMVVESPETTLFNLTPKSLYSEIKKLAEKRY